MVGKLSEYILNGCTTKVQLVMNEKTKKKNTTY